MAARARASVSLAGAVFVILTIAASMAGCSSTPPAPAPLNSRASAGSNTLLITIDTLRRDRLGAYGSRAGLTPTLDALASGGVRFTHAFSHVPLTLPAHASILTGRLPLRHGVHTNGSSRLPDDVPTLATVLEGAGYRTGAFVGAFVLDARFGLSRGFARYDDRLGRAGSPSFGFAERRGADVVQAAADWITAGQAAGPWFAWVHLFDPHAPYDAPAEYRAGRQPYDAEVAYADAMIERLLGRLRATGALDRTLVIVTADHGESLGDHGETTHGLFAYDATLAVPLILNGPGVGRGVLDADAGHADILPTIADLLGIPAPPGIDGVTLVVPPPAGRPIYFEALDASLTRDWAPLTGVVAGGWKFIDLPEPELYDRSGDPEETRNMAGQDPARTTALSGIRSAVVAAAGQAAAPPINAIPDRETEQRLRALGYVASRAAAPGPSGHRAYTADDDPKHLVVLNERFNTALSSFNDGQAAGALTGFDAVLAARPDFLTARTSAATVLVATGRAREAVALLRKAPAHQAESPDLLAKLGVAEREAGDLRGAAASLERARAAGAQNPELANDLGVVYARLGRADDARALFGELLRRDPDDAATWNNLGVLELSTRRLDQAAEAFRHAVAAEPERGDAWQGLGAALLDRDRSAAVDAWRRAERLLPHDYDLLFNLGMVLADGPAPREALPYLERFVREAPRDRDGADIARVERTIRGVKP